MKNSFCKFKSLALFSVVLLFLAFNCSFAFEGDITGNGYVDFEDLSVMSGKWLVSGCDVNDCDGADINSSGLVNMKDFSLLAGNWNSLDPSLIGWWKFDDLLSNEAADSTENSNNGTLQGDARKATWELGGAVELDGDGDFVEISSESDFDVTNGLTLTAWVKAKALKNDMKIISKGSAFCFGREYDSDFLTFSCAGIGRQITGSMNVFDLEWHHVAAVYDGTSESIYVDGILDNSKPASGNIIPNDENLLIGNTSIMSDVEWWGEIDDVRIYNRAVSQEELQNIRRPYYLEAVDMVPYDESYYEPNDMTLSWTPGELANSYDLYFGTDANEVEIADHGSDVYIGNFAADSNTYDPGILDDGIYYWRLEPIE